MSFGIPNMISFLARIDEHSGTSDLEAQLTNLTDLYLMLNQFQSTIKQAINQLMANREPEAERKENEAREALKKAEIDKEAVNNANALLKQKIHRVEIGDNEEEMVVEDVKEAKQVEAALSSQFSSPVLVNEGVRVDIESLVPPSPPNLTALIPECEVDTRPRVSEEERKARKKKEKSDLRAQKRNGCSCV
jgi:hypothetical protein